MNNYDIENIRTLGKLSIPHLWKDDDKQWSVFLLAKRMEIYAYSENILNCYCWHKKTYLQLKIKGLIFDVHESDDPIVSFMTDRSNLPLLLSLGTFKRRPHRNGRWLKAKERLLGHRILPLNIEKSALIKIFRQEQTIGATEEVKHERI